MELYSLVEIRGFFSHLFMLSTGYYFLRTAIISGGAGLLLGTEIARRKRVFRVEGSRPQLIQELRSNVLNLLFDALVAAVLIAFDLFKNTGGLRTWLFTFCGVFVWFEAWFYFTHRLLHSRALYFIHAQHHTAKVTGPLTALSFSIAERGVFLLGGVGLPAALSWWIPLSFEGFASYFALNFLLNVWGHLNLEFLPPSWIGSFYGEFLNATSYHALHHARYRGHYGLFTPYLDRWFGTRFEDYEKVHQWAYEGRGLESLGARVGEE